MSSCINHFSHLILPLMLVTKFLMEKWDPCNFPVWFTWEFTPKGTIFSPNKHGMGKVGIIPSFGKIPSGSSWAQKMRVWCSRSAVTSISAAGEAQHRLRLCWLQRQSYSKEKRERDQLPHSVPMDEGGQVSGAAPNSQPHVPWLKGFSCQETRAAQEGQASLWDIFFPLEKLRSV